VPDASVDVVVGIAILHHLDLDVTSREVFRVLRPGGRAIFKEPVRDSWLIRSIRDLIPYRAPDISPFERPLTTQELQQFAGPFSCTRLRSFRLPLVSAVQVAPVMSRWTDAAYRVDGWLLKTLPFLSRFSSITVFELTK
jgi:SAM-dependent methyltransferase